MRAPYGEINDDVRLVAGALGLKIIGWNADTEDWKYVSSPTLKEDVIEKFKTWTSQRLAGPISLQHDLFEATTLYTSKVVKVITKAGYTLKLMKGCIQVCYFYQCSNGIGFRS